MGRLTTAKCRVCRRGGIKLMLKGDKCIGMKCTFEKRKFAPGVKAKRGNRITNYLLQIREKQKLKKMYGLYEKQFHNIFNKAEKLKGPTGDHLVMLLERRLDNVLFRSCFAGSRQQSRQLIRHGHVLINGRKTNIPSYVVKQGDTILIKERSKKLYPILKGMTKLENEIIPEWLKIDQEQFSIKIDRLPEITDVVLPIKIQLIIELYSKV